MSGKTDLTKYTEDQKDLLAVKVAHRLADLREQSDIAQELGLTVKQLNTFANTDRVQKIMEDLKDDAKRTAKASIGKKGRRLMNKAIAGLEQALDKGSVEGVKVVFKALGVIDEKESDIPDASITVIMPTNTEKSIEVESVKNKTKS